VLNEQYLWRVLQCSMDSSPHTQLEIRFPPIVGRDDFSTSL
jgi:hypothetical protein